MKFIPGRIGSKIDIEAKLRNSKEAIIATAYFKPRDPTMESLGKVRNLKLIYSDEYQITVPQKLWQLVSNGAEVRYVPTSDAEGKLHAKIYCGIRKKGSKFAFVGSGNLTDDGLFKNQEAGVLFDSENPEDHETIEKIFVWLTDLWAQHESHIFNETKYVEAKSRHEAAKRWLRNKPKEPSQIHPWKENTQADFKKDWTDINYWMLKTTEDHNGPSHWDEFIRENIIAIGFKKGDGVYARKMIDIFKNGFKIGDLVVICEGYVMEKYDSRKQIFGAARVTGHYEDKEPYPVIPYNEHAQWKKRRQAEIKEIRRLFVPKSWLKDCFGGSMRQTIHPIDKFSFEKFATRLYEDYHKRIDV